MDQKNLRGVSQQGPIADGSRASSMVSVLGGDKSESKMAVGLVSKYSDMNVEQNHERWLGRVPFWYVGGLAGFG
jgi:hypothetical protein